MPQLYPGWTMRVYYDLPPDSGLLADLCQFACDQPHLDLCYVRHLPSHTDIAKVFAMIWRFFPVLDPHVDLFLSRDLDSRYICYVEQVEENNSKFKKSQKYADFKR